MTAQGWGRNYSFSTGDLVISANVLYNYLESSNVGTVPWEELCYIFGNIMYGGHITDEWDRRTCTTYLETLLNDNLFGEGMSGGGGGGGGAGRLGAPRGRRGLKAEGWGGAWLGARDALEAPPPLQGAQPMPSHCLTGGKCPL